MTMSVALLFPALARRTALLAVSITWLAVAGHAVAERLHFSDGESITGTLVAIENGTVKWKSPILGNLSIEQRHVQGIESLEHFDLRLTGRELYNCWMVVQQGRQLLYCEDGVRKLASWGLVVSAGEAVDEPLPPLAHTGTMRFAAEDSKGNNDITKFNFDGGAELRYIESRHTVQMRYQQESAEGQSTRNMWRTSYQYDQFFTERWFVTGVGFYEEDEFREIDRRGSAGLGMGYQFLETRAFNLRGKTTLNYLDERFNNGVERTTPAFLWNLNFGWRLNERGMEFFHRHGLLQAIDSGEDWEVNTITGLRYPINGHFSSTVQLELDYDNLPAEDAVDKRDQKWSIGVNYDW